MNEGWFSEQLKQRRMSDDELFARAMIDMTGAVLGDKTAVALMDDRQITQNSIEEILKYYHLRITELPPGIETAEEKLDFLTRPYGIMYRTVKLQDGWFRDAMGPMLAIRKEGGELVALLPKQGFSGYTFIKDGAKKTVTDKDQDYFEDEAICFYKPFPLRKLGISDLIRYMAGCVSLWDVLPVIGAMFAALFLGLIQPRIQHALFSDIVDSGSLRVLSGAGAFLISLLISTTIIGSIKNLLMSKIQIKISVNVQAATMMRVLSLPAGFFRSYTSGELSRRMQYVNELSSAIMDMVLSTGLTSIFSLAYITQIFAYAPDLVAPSLFIILVTVVFSVISTFLQIRISREKMELSAKESGLTHSLVTGVQKLRLGGAEKRAFSMWAIQYSKSIRLQYNPMLFLKLNAVISQGISLFGMIYLYYRALESGISVADYRAFSSAYGMVSGAFLSLSGIALQVAQIKPILEMVEPFLKTVPEISERKMIVKNLAGGIELNHISFRYSENMPKVLDDISIRIRPKQYIAIVGKTGCGKSTLMRLLLGFETPQKGAIYYDGKDMNRLDLKSLRKNIGSVMQNGKLFIGSIYENITISCPTLSLAGAWDAAEKAGLGDDIRRMPMGMQTVISEGSGGISGGQKQRLLIARAIAPKPGILIFDEATSALDNITQKKVSEALNGLNCTRIVIAHRLSTIMECDRILVLDNGKIIEDGTYEELIARKGFFAELVERQRLDRED